MVVGVRGLRTPATLALLESIGPHHVYELDGASRFWYEAGSGLVQ